MHRAIDLMHLVPEFIIVDGINSNPTKRFHLKPLSKEMPSIKVLQLLLFWQKPTEMTLWKRSTKISCYHWKKNKGYPTQEHRAAIAKIGVTEYHRKSFKLLPTQLRLDLDKNFVTSNSS